MVYWRVKGQPKNLSRESQRLFDETELKRALSDKRRYWASPVERVAGKVGSREVYCMPIAGGFFENWEGVCTLIRHDRQSEDINRKTCSQETRYYISNMNGSAQLLGHLIRRHREIETFHRYLDKMFADDQNGNTDKDAYCNFGIIKKLVFSSTKHLRAIKGNAYVADIRNKFLYDYCNPNGFASLMRFTYY